MGTTILTLLFVPFLLHLQVQQVTAVQEHDPPAQAEKAPDLAGRWYRGDGLGVNLRLELREDGTYSQTWHGCLGKYGEAAGEWKFEEGQVRFTPTEEEGMLRGRAESLDVEEHEGGWVLVPTSERAREFHERWGPSPSSCYVRLEPREVERAAEKEEQEQDGV